MIPKAKTLIEKHGFNDPDRKSSTHDEMQIWVLQNFRTVIKRTLNVEVPDIEFHLVMEHPVVDRNYIVGFVDLYCSRFNVAIEVKSMIGSIGDLVRQINFYKTYLHAKTWIVVSPDDRFKDILKQQEIHIFKYGA